MTDPNTPQAQAAPGWYPAGVPGQERYWDGATWTEQTRPGQPAASAPVATAVAESTPAPGAKKPWYKRPLPLILIGIGVLLVLIIGIGAANADPEPTGAEAPLVQEEPAEDVEPAADVTVPETTGMTAKEARAALENAGLEVEFSAAEGVVLDQDNWTVLSTSPAAGGTAKTGDTVVVTVEKILSEAEKAAAAAEEQRKAAEQALAAMTVAQQSAVRSAQSYLDFKGFSRAGLHQQLTSEYGEGFAPEDAEFAIAHLEQTGQVDWNAEAVQSAESYLDFKGFSRQGLFEQLTSEYGESFTPEQANHALDTVGLQ